MLLCDIPVYGQGELEGIKRYKQGIKRYKQGLKRELKRGLKGELKRGQAEKELKE